MANSAIDLPEVMEGISKAFTARSCWYNFKRGRRWRRLEKLNGRMQGLHNVETRQSQQISLEAQWLINYTDDWARADQTLDRFEASLDQGNAPYEQQPDGSWGVGCTEFYRKLEVTVDALQDTLDGPTLRPLTFMQHLQDPQRVRDLLDGLRVSRIRETGRNNRDEFGSLITSLSQLFFKKKVKEVFEAHPKLGFSASQPSFVGLRDYLWGIQSPVTGYWGPTYRFDREVEVQDLSFTFHVVKYYNDKDTRFDIPKTDKIIATTELIETFSYPNGLKPNPRDGGPTPEFSDHNNYDLVTMFQQMWRGMPDDAKVKARNEIQTLIDWCLTKSLQEDNTTFGPTPDMSRANSYYYGISFLAVVGFWLRAPFWTAPPIPAPAPTPPPKELAAKLLTRFEADFNDHTKAARDVITMLNDAKNGVVHPITLAATPAAQCAAARVSA